jgi:magnesium-transporting ATPase (P-type)
MKCGYENAAGQAYCIKCGAQLAVVSQTSTDSGPQRDILGLTLGKKVSGSAALLALVFFFLPWVTVSCGASWSLTGYDLATFSTSSYYGTSDVPGARFLLLAIPIAALLILAIVLRARNVERSALRSAAIAEVWLSVVGGLLTLAVLLYFESARRNPQLGGLGMALFRIDPAFYLTLLSFAAVLVGARLDLSDTG